MNIATTITAASAATMSHQTTGRKAFRDYIAGVLGRRRVRGLHSGRAIEDLNISMHRPA